MIFSSPLFLSHFFLFHFLYHHPVPFCKCQSSSNSWLLLKINPQNINCLPVVKFIKRINLTLNISTMGKYFPIYKNCPNHFFITTNRFFYSEDISMPLIFCSTVASCFFRLASDQYQIGKYFLAFYAYLLGNILQQALIPHTSISGFNRKNG